MNIDILKYNNLKELNTVIEHCVRCELCYTRNNVVVGRGSFKPLIVFVGEAPGQQEDIQGKPFVGRSGDNLNIWIKYINLSNEEYSIINLIKCRPPNNRDPLQSEIDKCSEWLENQLIFLSPKVIVPIGRIAASYFLGNGFKSGILSYCGNFYTTEEREQPIYPIIHPSYFLRNGNKGWEKQLENLKEWYTKNVNINSM